MYMKKRSITKIHTKSLFYKQLLVVSITILFLMTSMTSVLADQNYCLHIIISGNGEVTKDPDYSIYASGTTVYLNASWSEGWGFDHWGGALSGNDWQETIVIYHTTWVYAYFEEAEHSLDITILPSSNAGFVSKEPDQTLYFQDQEVEINATAETGWMFDCWSGDVPTGYEYTNPLNIIMDEPKSISAVFVETIHILDIFTDGSGDVSVDPVQTAYADGQEVNLIADADDGWSFDHWSGDVLNPDDASTSIIMDEDEIVTAHFTQDQYLLTIDIDGWGSVDKYPESSDNYYLSGEYVELTANAGSSWRFDYWSDDLSGSSNPKSIQMDGPKEVTAHFIEGTITLNTYIFPQDYGNVLRNPDQYKYFEDQTVTITADAVPGYGFDYWFCDDDPDIDGSTDNPETIDTDQDKTVFAYLSQRADQYLTVNVEGSGSVDKCPDSSDNFYLFGECVQLTANADLGWSFDHWSDDLSGSSNPEDIIMDENRVVTAHFTQDQYILTVNVEGSGSVSRNLNQPTYLYGDIEELTAHADSGWSFSHWSGDLTGTMNPDTITMNEDKSVTAHFIETSGLLAFTNDGLYMIKYGNLYRTYLEDDQWNSQVIFHNGGDLIEGSLISGFDDDIAKVIYGVDEFGTVFTTHVDSGVISLILPEFQDVVPGSLILGTGMDFGEIPGVFGVTTSGQVVCYRFVVEGGSKGNSKTTSFSNVQSAHWGRRTVYGVTVDPGSLVCGDIGIFGVDLDGRVIQVGDYGDVLIGWPVLSSFSDVVPGSLCWGDSMDSGDFSAPGLYGVTTSNDVVNYLDSSGNGNWVRRTTNLVLFDKALPGSLVFGNSYIYGVDPQGSVFSVRQENGDLVYDWILPEFQDVVPGSLCWGTGMFSGDDSAPGLYGVIISGKIVNYHWLDDVNGCWERRNPVDGGDALAGSLVCGISKMFGVDNQGHIVMTWQHKDDLQYEVITTENNNQINEGVSK